MDIRFACTQCGKCCHDLRLPLSVDEALVWAGRGHRVDLLGEALPASVEIDRQDALGRYRADRSFGARSGSLPIRVHVTLVARHVGPCPHLRPNMLCGNYELRPRVCRIYPAEIVPDIALSPASKMCPPEAWAASQPVFVRGGEVESDETQTLIEQHRAATLGDVDVKARACTILGMNVAALANEGYAVCSPRPTDFVAALECARSARHETDCSGEWALASNRSSTLQMIEDGGGVAEARSAGDDYLAFFGDEF